MLVKFCGIDSWNRPIFKGENGLYYGSVDILFSYESTEKEVLEKVTEEWLVYFGRKFGCEPMGTRPQRLLEIDRGGNVC